MARVYAPVIRLSESKVMFLAVPASSAVIVRFAPRIISSIFVKSSAVSTVTLPFSVTSSPDVKVRVSTSTTPSIISPVPAVRLRV